MSPKKTIIWCLVAAGLFGFIFFFHPRARLPALGAGRVLPQLRSNAVSSISIRPSGPVQLQIRVIRTNDTWQMNEPLVYPAQTEKVLKFLVFLEQLKPATYISGNELRTHANADEEFGFAAPQATVALQQGDYQPRLRVGALTTPGDQVFLQIEGDLGAFVVDAELLKHLPRSANDWRDTTLLNLNGFVFDHVAVTNNATGDALHGGLPASSSTFVLQRDATNLLWRLVWPLDARANQSRIEEALNRLQALRIHGFVTDEPKPDLEPLGLSPVELELGFSNGTNNVAVLQFGKSPTNDLSQVYARRAGQPGVFSVDKKRLLPWCAFLSDFRDPHVLNMTDAVDSIEFLRAEERSSVQRQTDGSWRVLPGDFAADSDSVRSLLSGLTNLEILKFVNDVVNPADLPEYGLAPSIYHLTLRTNGPSAAGVSNTAVVELDFGLVTNAPDKVFAKRADESSVYAISTNDFARLPLASWQLRDRKLCHFSLGDVSGLILHLNGRISEMIHKGPLSWSFAPGSQGIVNDAAIEETVKGVIQSSAIAWTARGEQSRATYGLVENGYHFGLKLKAGTEFDLEFGGLAPSGNVYAAVVLEGQPWIFEFPWMLYRDIATYLPLKPD
jgi:hypothetical protein